MDGRESMAQSGSSSYYLHRGFSGSGSVTNTGLHAPPSFRSPTNPNFSVQSNVRDSSVGPKFPVENTSPSFPHGLNMGVPMGEPAKKKRGRPPTNPNISVQSNVRDSSVGPTFPVENTSPSFPHGLNMGVPMGEPVKRKRGRPRKYGPDGTNMSLGLSPMSASGSITPTAKRARGRPPGSGRKQQLASLGEWVNSSAGLAFTPHVINIAEGEDIASKVLSFSQQRPRALCILSANGAVSSVTLRQPTSSGRTVTYEGRFQILCLSGSYLVAESGGPRSRTGGLSVSLCSPDGYVVGGGVGGMLIAAGPVQVVVCSFVYGGSKSKNKTEVDPTGEQSLVLQSGEKPGPPSSPTPRHNLAPNSSFGVWPNLRNLQTEIDLRRG